MTSAFPEITVFAGPLNAAIDATDRYGSSAAATASGRAKMAAIAPPFGRACISRPRAAMSFAPSSRLNTPALQAAANSPTLWPSTADGRMPQDFQSSASAYSIAKIAGWA